MNEPGKSHAPFLPRKRGPVGSVKLAARDRLFFCFADGTALFRTLLRTDSFTPSQCRTRLVRGRVQNLC